MPCDNQDLDELISRLPKIHEGAEKWIKVLEEGTTSKLLVIGDIKALLAKCLGVSKMNEILGGVHLHQAIDNPRIDGAPFDKHQAEIWLALRTEYPKQMNPMSLKAVPIGNTENPNKYIQRQLRHWKQELERDLVGDPVMTALFRTTVVDAMPPRVKVKLQDVVGLNSKTHKEFCDHVAYAVKQYRKNDQKLKSQNRRLQRKLTQLQLEQLTLKKMKIQVAVKCKEEEQSVVMAPVNMPKPVAQSTTVVLVPFIQNITSTENKLQPLARIVIYARPDHPNKTNWTRPQQEGQRGKRQNNGQQRVNSLPGVCWGCKQPGHNRRDYPTNPWKK